MSEIIRSKEFIEAYPEDLVFDPKDNFSRWHKGKKHKYSPEEIEKQVAAFEMEGQLQPIGARKVPGESAEDDQCYKVCYGFLRYEAAVAYNKKHPDSPMKLRCQIVDATEKEGYIKNLDENIRRKSLTPMDLAQAFEKLRNDLEWKDVEIANHWDFSSSYITKLKALINIPVEAQEKVASGEYSMEDAETLAKLPEDKQKEVMEKASESNTPEPSDNGDEDKPKKKKSGVKQAARETQTDESKPSIAPLKLAEFKSDVIEKWLEGDSEGLKSLASNLQKILEGRKLGIYEKKIKSLLGEEEEEPTAKKGRKKELAEV